jgi:HSP20 family protein
MSLNKFNGNFPSLIDELFGRDMDQIFNFNRPASGWPLSRVGSNVPAVNIREDENQYHLEVAAPGMRKEDFKVMLEDGVLTVSTEQKQEHAQQDEQGSYTKREFSYHSFSRSFRLPDSCAQEHIQARYADGVLHLEIPKNEEAKRKAPRQIQIA